MKNLLFSISFVVAVLLLGSCSMAKQVPYFLNIDSVSLAVPNKYDAHIMPKDQLTITVVTTNPESAKPFNLSSQAGSGASGASGLSYLVNNDGDINFPVIGKIHVGGLTKNECEDLIYEKIKPYLAEAERPVVIVNMSSFRVTVAGEVGSPTVVPVTTEKMSIMEALAQAGDLTIYGKRQNVLLIREKADGQKEVHRLNLNDANLINSPYYYVQQNDYIYVEPQKMKSNNTVFKESTQTWITIASLFTSLASLAITIVRL